MDTTNQQASAALAHLDSFLLGTLGYEVLDLTDGVYQLRSAMNPESPDCVGLLLAPYPLESRHLPLKLFLQPVAPGVAAREIADHWRTIDARRFEETGLQPVELEMELGEQGAVTPLAFQRPEFGVRFAIELPSGDVVCFN